MDFKTKAKVVVGMSGGVDSSMAAALLKEKGYDVLGVTLQVWKDSPAIDDARRVALKLRIPHYVMDFRACFEKNVVDYFIQSYLAGETPNPCIACNRHIKFGEMLHKAQGLGADYIATGHYAQVLRNSDNGRFLLSRCADARKDQTYALYMLTQEQLAHTLFPLSGYTKDQVRKMAHEHDLKVANKPDSQEICFVPDNDYASFIQERLNRPIKQGNFVDRSGKILGKHRGIIHYTIGQRKGLGGTFGKPMFVIGLNPGTNEVVLGENDEVYTDMLWANDLNWISIPDLRMPLEVEAKIRYNSAGARATIYPVENGTRVKVNFTEPQRAVTPGQAVVFYQDNLVVGGGRISSVPRSRQ